ncbi:MAG: hypothetical protein PHR35_07485, partial [Kiritimatiellae bacterium]|nr:hypothetical protein [Kiritimatiellia bacterium]
LLTEIGKLSPGLVPEAWMALWKENFLDLLSRIEKVVHEVNPNIRLGLMPVQNFIRNFGEDFLREAIRAVSRGTRPLLRTHDYHGLPHEMFPGSGLAAKRTAPPESEHVVEIENIAHNCHDYMRSPQTTRYAILSALALGMGGAAPTFGDSERDMPWERKYLDMLRVNDRFFRAVADLTYRGTLQGGIPIRRRAYQREVGYMDARENIWDASLSEDPDLLAGLFGVAYRFDACPVWLLGELPVSMSKAEVDAALDRGAIVDAPGLACLLRLGYGDRLGVRLGDSIPYRRGHRLLEHPLNGAYGGNVNALRVAFPTYRLEAAHGRYEEISEFVSWTGRRVAGGILVQRGGQGRNVILPHVLSTAGGAISGIVNVPYRHMMRSLLGFALGEPLKLAVEAPPRIAPYYFERDDGAVIVTLLNAYYDDMYDVDLLFGDGARLCGRKVYRVMSNGRIAHRPTLKVRRAKDGSYRLRLYKTNVLANCDVLVLMIG